MQSGITLQLIRGRKVILHAVSYCQFADKVQILLRRHLNKTCLFSIIELLKEKRKKKVPDKIQDSHKEIFHTTGCDAVETIYI